jgi:hypothetical protein
LKEGDSSLQEGEDKEKKGGLFGLGLTDFVVDKVKDVGGMIKDVLVGSDKDKEEDKGEDKQDKDLVQ